MNYCVIEMRNLHFDFLLQRGEQLMNYTQTTKPILCGHGEVQEDIQVQGMSAWIERHELEFSFQSQETWERGGQNPSIRDTSWAYIIEAKGILWL